MQCAILEDEQKFNEFLHYYIKIIIDNKQIKKAHRCWAFIDPDKYNGFSVDVGAHTGTTDPCWPVIIKSDGLPFFTNGLLL